MKVKNDRTNERDEVETRENECTFFTGAAGIFRSYSTMAQTLSLQSEPIKWITQYHLHSERLLPRSHGVRVLKASPAELEGERDVRCEARSARGGCKRRHAPLQPWATSAVSHIRARHVSIVSCRSHQMELSSSLRQRFGVRCPLAIAVRQSRCASRPRHVTRECNCANLIMFDATPPPVSTLRILAVGPRRCASPRCVAQSPRPCRSSRRRPAS